jgi:hypothetical protein
MNFPQVKESSELSRLKALADNDLDSTCGFIQGGTDDFSKNNTDQDNNTITFSLYNPTTSPLNVELYGFDPANFTTVPVNAPPTIQALFPTTAPQSRGNTGSFCIPNNTLYASNFVADTIDVIDCNTNAIITTIAVPIGFVPSETCYCPVNNQIYVGSAGFPQAIRIDCNTNTIIGPPIVTSATFTGAALVYNSVKNTIYAMAQSIPSDIIEISCSSNLQIAFFTSFLFPPLTQIGGISFNPIFNRIYINDNTGSNLFVIDCTTNTVLSVIPLPIVPNIIFAGNVYCSFNNSIYIISSTTNQYVRFDCVTSIVSAPAATTIINPSGIAYNPINNLIYISGTAFYVQLDVTTNILSLPIFTPINLNYLCYNQNINKLFGFRGAVLAVGLAISPLFAPTVTINLPGGITPAMIYNDTQTKPFLIRGVRIITDNFSQWSNNITFSNNSYTGALDAKQWQPLNYISPTNANTLIVDAPDFVLDVDRGPDSTALDFKIEPLTNVILLFTVGKSLDSSTIFCQQDKEHVDNTTAIRFTGNPIADIFLSTMTKEQITEQESKYSSVEYANYPRETGNPIADIALLRNYGIQGI